MGGRPSSTPLAPNDGDWLEAKAQIRLSGLRSHEIGENQDCVAEVGLMKAQLTLGKVAKDKEAKKGLNDDLVTEVVCDKSYHSNDILVHLEEIRSYVSEPDRGKRHWEGKLDDQQAVYANRRRIHGERGKALMRKRAEIVERGFAHCYETGAMRQLHLRHHGNILKRLLVHVAGFNMGLVMQ